MTKSRSNNCGHDLVHMKQYPSRANKPWECMECARIRARQRRRDGLYSGQVSARTLAEREAKKALEELRAWVAVERSKSV